MLVFWSIGSLLVHLRWLEMKIPCSPRYSCCSRIQTRKWETNNFMKKINLLSASECHCQNFKMLYLLECNLCPASRFEKCSQQVVDKNL